MSVALLIVIPLLLLPMIPANAVTYIKSTEAGKTPVITPVTPAEYLQKAINEAVLDLSKKYEINVALAIKIIKCESGNKINAIGRGAKVGLDRGLLQVNDFYHGKKAKEMGFDLTKPVESLEYGIWLMEKEGTRHWKASAKCWQT